MKKLAVAVLMGSLFLGVGQSLRAHDEGHGPKLTDEGKQGGVVSPIIDKKDIKKGAKAAVVYKAELVRSEDGMVSVYLYDKEMNPLDLAKFGKEAKGIVETEKKGKYTKVPFSLNISDGMFAGATPKPASKPFNIDVTFKEDQRELLAAFDNLD